MRVLIAAVTAATLLATSALGADITSPTNGPLAPGKPAGVKEAQLRGNMLLYGALGVGVIVAVVLLTNNGKDTPTGSTGTTP